AAEIEDAKTSAGRQLRDRARNGGVLRIAFAQHALFVFVREPVEELPDQRGIVAARRTRKPREGGDDVEAELAPALVRIPLSASDEDLRQQQLERVLAVVPRERA